MTKESYSNIIKMVENMVPPPQTLAEAIAEAAPVWAKLIQSVSDPTEESGMLLVMSAQTMMTFFSQALLQEIATDIAYLRGKEEGRGIRTKVVV